MIRPRVLASLCLALATGSSAQIFTAQTHTICKTFFAAGATSGVVETISQTQTFSLNPTVTITTTPLTTETPNVVTVTTTDTMTLTGTAVVVTDTYFSTTTVVESTTVSITTTSTSTDVSVTLETLPTVTSLSDAPADFIYPTPTTAGVPVTTQTEALPLFGDAKKKTVSRLERLRRSQEEANKALRAQNDGPANNRSIEGPVKLPFKVVCEIVVESIVPTTVTSTALTTSTVFAETPTLTNTVDTTIVTVSAPPDASTTVTFTDFDTTSFTSTATVTTGTTTTVTATYQPVETYYDQCGPQNQISRDPADTQLTLAQDLGDTVILLNTPDAYACCVACINTPGCAGSNYIAEYYQDGEACGLDLFNTCPSGQSQVAGTYYAGADVPNTISNGPCGYYSQMSL